MFAYANLLNKVETLQLGFRWQWVWGVKKGQHTKCLKSDILLFSSHQWHHITILFQSFVVEATYLLYIAVHYEELTKGKVRTMPFCITQKILFVLILVRHILAVSTISFLPNYKCFTTNFNVFHYLFSMTLSIGIFFFFSRPTSIGGREIHIG